MIPGFYVCRRRSDRRSNKFLILESRLFRVDDKISSEHAHESADNWRDWIQSEHPKDEVFIIEVKAPLNRYGDGH